MEFTRILNPGKIQSYNDRLEQIFVRIHFDGKRLCLSGVIGPRKNGNAVGGCGQINPVNPDVLGKDWTPDMIDLLNQIWERWHLNDLRAGTPAQEACIRQSKALGWEPNLKNYYHSCCVLLQENGLYEDDGYVYGSGWQFEEVPADILDLLQMLPSTTKKPAWV